MTNQDNSPNLSNENECTNTKKGDCPAVLNQLWTKQLQTRQVESEKAYAKKHSLEIAFGPKIFAAKLADRSNFLNHVA